MSIIYNKAMNKNVNKTNIVLFCFQKINCVF